MTKVPKTRLDVLLVERGLVESRAKAQALILAGQVVVNDERIDKPGHNVSADAVLRLKDVPRYVSRGGLKLEAALRNFAVRVQNAVCLDVGASTGGFSDCLLKHGARKIYAVDVGQNQLHHNLVTDARVVSLEKTNFRHMNLDLIGEAIEVCVMDVSFISIEKLLPQIVKVRERQTQPLQVVFLIKPQFEVEPHQVGKGGIVKDTALHNQVTERVQQQLAAAGFVGMQILDSPVLGADGNKEFLIFAELL